MAATCPLESWNPTDPAELANPYATFAVARAEHPVFFSQALQAWVVTRYDDVMTVIRDTDAFTSRDSIRMPVPEEAAAELPEGYPWDHPSLINLDPPAHARIRKLANQAFKPSAIAAKEQDVRAIADTLIDGFVADGQADLMTRFAEPFPGLVMCRLLDVPDDDVEQVIAWTDGFLVMLDPRLSPQQRLDLAREAARFHRFCDAFVQARMESPGDDVMSSLVRARSRDVDGAPALERLELISVFSHLLIGGLETTRRLIGNMILRLLEHPDQLAEVREDQSLLDAAVEESLRHSSPTKGLFRHTTQEVQIGGATIPAGAAVVVMWAAANHDENHFERPEEFDIHRPDVSQHLAFSRGAHFCIGAPLARLELKVALHRILERLPGLRRADDAPLEWAPLPLHHGLMRLPLAWDVSA